MKLPALEAEIQDAIKFKDVYQFTFNYAKNQGQKGLDLEMAIAYWNIILRGRFKFLDLWCSFLQVCKTLVLVLGLIRKLYAYQYLIQILRNTTSVLYQKTRGTCFLILPS
jgi:Cullin binding